MITVGTHNQPPGREHNLKPPETEAGPRRSGRTPRDKTSQSSSYLALVSGINGSAEGLYLSYMNVQ
jgi:hypothetical protein